MKIGLITGAGRAQTYVARAQALDPSIVIEPIEVTVSGLPRSEVELRLVELAYLDAGVTVASRGCDAVVINTVCDYGFSLPRSALGIPVVGAGHASLMLARSLGQSFSIVTVWPARTGWLYRRMLREYGLTESCSDLVHVNDESDIAASGGAGGLMNEIEQGGPAGHARIGDGAAATISRGADVVVLGCCCMGAAAEPLRSRVDVPVIEPFMAACETAATLVRLGVRQSNVGASPPSLGELAQARRAARAMQSASGDDECSFCSDGEEPSGAPGGALESATA